MKNPKWMAAVAAMVVCLTAVYVLPAKAAEKAKDPYLTLYGVEMDRNPEIMLYEFEDFAKKHPKASSFLWKTLKVSYAGEGSVILAGYSPDRAKAEKIRRSVPGSKILKIMVSPTAVSSNGALAVYGFPLAGSEDSVVGDVWVVSRGEWPRRVEEGVLLGYVHPENATVFTVAGFSKDEASFVYCLGPCTRYEVKTGKKIPADPIVK